VLSFRVGDARRFRTQSGRIRASPEWVSDDHLRTRQVRPAITRHPVTGETVWFNHMAFWHVSSLEKDLRELLVSGYSEELHGSAGLSAGATFVQKPFSREVLLQQLRNVLAAKVPKPTSKLKRAATLFLSPDSPAPRAN